jgi:hypothetical protein
VIQIGRQQHMSIVEVRVNYLSLPPWSMTLIDYDLVAVPGFYGADKPISLQVTHRDFT